MTEKFRPAASGTRSIPNPNHTAEIRGRRADDGSAGAAVQARGGRGGRLAEPAWGDMGKTGCSCWEQEKEATTVVVTRDAIPSIGRTGGEEDGGLPGGGAAHSAIFLA